MVRLVRLGFVTLVTFLWILVCYAVDWFSTNILLIDSPMLILILTAFIAGVATIFSPCILPVLPLVLSSSLTGGRRRPFGVLLGFVVSFTFFALSLTFLVRAFGIDAGVLRSVAIVVLVIFGLTLLVPGLQKFWERLTSGLASKGSSLGQGEGDGFWSGFGIGLTLGLVWAPCAGPIMASVLALSATQSVTLVSVFITLAYSVGATLPMLVIIYLGRRFVTGSLLKTTGVVQKVFGVIIIVVALAISRGWDLLLLQKLNYGAGITKFIEENELVNEKLDELAGLEEVDDGVCKVAPGFEEGGEWLNSPALNIEDLRGKPVLVKFWTYTCINCIRTFPFVNDWYEKYEDDGLQIIGVHTPEFEFEKDISNVEKALEDYGIEYPVVLDNDYKIWRSYKNRYWPAKYLIDANGCIVDEHFGEGAYEETELKIQKLLGVDEEISAIESYKAEGSKTSERYLGYSRTENFASNEGILLDEIASYSFPSLLALDEHAFAGEWLVSDERALAMPGAKLRLHFSAKEVYLVMRASEASRVIVRLDGEIVDEFAGEDVVDGEVAVMQDRLYKLIKFSEFGEGNLELEFPEGGVEVFAFTFG